MAIQLTLSKQKIALVSQTTSYHEFTNIIKQIIRKPKNGIYEIDFSQVGYINNTGVKYFILNLIETFKNLTTDQHFYSFYLSNLSEEYQHRYNIEAILIQEKMSILIKEDEQPVVIGYAPKITQNILDILFLNKQNELTSKEITIEYNNTYTQSTKKSINSIATQLNTLYQAGLIKRVFHTSPTGGRNYIYSSLF